MTPVGQVAGLLVQYHTASTALTSLDEIMKRDVERPEDASFIGRGALRGAIEFKEVGFTYPGQETPSLRNVSLSIQPGEHVAILGRVGSGKTTLERLILGLYRPTEGAVLIDGIDLRQLDPAELRRQIGYVQQDVVLFYGTLRENLAMGAPLADDAAVVRAAEIAGRRGAGRGQQREQQGRSHRAETEPGARLCSPGVGHAGSLAFLRLIALPGAGRRPCGKPACCGPGSVGRS